MHWSGPFFFLHFLTLFSTQKNRTENVKNGFLLKKKSKLVTNMQIICMWNAVRPYMYINICLSVKLKMS